MAGKSLIRNGNFSQKEDRKNQIYYNNNKRIQFTGVYNVPFKRYKTIKVV